MVKTHRHSYFVLMSLNEIRNTQDVLLQIKETGSKFNDGNPPYLCEKVSAFNYRQTSTQDSLTAELMILNSENRKLNKKIVSLQNKILKLEGRGDV